MGVAASDGLLLGRVTYEHLVAFWPNQPGGTPMVDNINSVRKRVVSETPGEPLEWINSTLTKGNVAEAVVKLRRSGRTPRGVTDSGTSTIVHAHARRVRIQIARVSAGEPVNKAASTGGTAIALDRAGEGPRRSFE